MLVLTAPNEVWDTSDWTCTKVNDSLLEKALSLGIKINGLSESNGVLHKFCIPDIYTAEALKLKAVTGCDIIMRGALLERLNADCDMHFTITNICSSINRAYFDVKGVLYLDIDNRLKVNTVSSMFVSKASVTTIVFNLDKANDYLRSCFFSCHGLVRQYYIDAASLTEAEAELYYEAFLRTTGLDDNIPEHIIQVLARLPVPKAVLGCMDDYCRQVAKIDGIWNLLGGGNYAQKFIQFSKQANKLGVLMDLLTLFSKYSDGKVSILSYYLSRLRKLGGEV